jgi:hypothetical protein
MKNKALENVSKTFNNKSFNGHRNDKCLKIKYKNLKKSVKVKLPDVNAKP